MNCCKHEAQGELIICLHVLARARQENADSNKLSEIKRFAQELAKKLGEPWATEARRLYATGKVISLRSGIEFLEIRTGEAFGLMVPTLKWAGKKTPLPDEQSIIQDINQAITDLVCCHHICGVDVLADNYQTGIEQALRSCRPLVQDPRISPQDLMPLESFNNMLRTVQNAGIRISKNPCFCHPFVNASVAFQQAWKAHADLCKDSRYRIGLTHALCHAAEVNLA